MDIVGLLPSMVPTWVLNLDWELLVGIVGFGVAVTGVVVNNDVFFVVADNEDVVVVAAAATTELFFFHHGDPLDF